MKKILLFIALAVGAVSAALVAGCEKTPPQQPTGGVELKLSTETFNNVAGEGMRLTVTVTTEADWTIELPTKEGSEEKIEWIELSASSGNGTGRVEIDVLTNDGAARQAVLTVTAGDIVKTITINQLAFTGEPVLRVPTNEFHGIAKAGETISLRIVSAIVEWTITELPDWCTIAPEDMSGTGGKTISVAVAANSGDDKRNATFRISGDGAPSVSVVVSQLGGKMFMPDPVLRANEAYNNRIEVIDASTGEFRLTDKGRAEISVASLCQSTLAGLEHYPNLLQLVINGDAVQDRNLTEVDVRALRKLEILVLNGCPKVKTVRANDMPSLLYVDIMNSGNSDRVAIEEINVQGSAKIDSLGCGNGKLKKLDVSGATGLTKIVVYNNQLTEITGLDDCANLTRLQCGNNRIAELDLTNNGRLEWLSCGLNELTELNVKHMSNLHTLLVEGLNITELDVSKNDNLNYMACYRSALGTLDLSGRSKLMFLECYNMPNLQTIDLGGCNSIRLVGFTGDIMQVSSFNNTSGALNLGAVGGAFPSFREIVVDANSAIKSLVSNGNDLLTSISARNCASLNSVVLKDNLNLRSLDLTGSSPATYDVSGNHPSFVVTGRD